MEAASAEEQKKQGYVNVSETISHTHTDVPLETVKVLKILFKDLKTSQKSRHQNGIPIVSISYCNYFKERYIKLCTEQWKDLLK